MATPTPPTSVPAHEARMTAIDGIATTETLEHIATPSPLQPVVDAYRAS